MWSDAYLDQARSDWNVYLGLAGDSSVPPCHELHYLQMATEKLSKAFLLASTSNPSKMKHGHSAFVKFLRTASRSPALAQSLGMHGRQLKSHLDALKPVAFEVERLAPALAHGGANSEYPWEDPAGIVHHPAAFAFQAHALLSSTSGRSLLKLVEYVLRNFSRLFS